MSIRLFHIDSFAGKAFQGNPAAVCLLDSEQPTEWMQNVAAELNLSETAFVLRTGDHYSLRWFTPTVEVDLCGHATLATAFVLWHTGATEESLSFQSKSGLLKAQKKGYWIELDFPAAFAEETSRKDKELTEGLGAAVHSTGLVNEWWVTQVKDEQSLRGLRPNFQFMRENDLGAVIATTSKTDTHDMVSRVFVPGFGIDEDPATGAAHCVLAPYWNKRLGQTSFKALQASKRGAEIELELAGERVFLRGQAQLIYKAELFV